MTANCSWSLLNQRLHGAQMVGETMPEKKADDHSDGMGLAELPSFGANVPPAMIFLRWRSDACWSTSIGNVGACA